MTKLGKEKRIELANLLWEQVKKYTGSWDEKTLNSKPTGYILIFTDGIGTWSDGGNINNGAILSEVMRVVRE